MFTLKDQLPNGKIGDFHGRIVAGAAEAARPHKGVIKLGGKTTNAAPDSDEQFERRIKRYERMRAKEQAEAEAELAARINAESSADVEAIEGKAS